MEPAIFLLSISDCQLNIPDFSDIKNIHARHHFNIPVLLNMVWKYTSWQRCVTGKRLARDMHTPGP
jgi:hypothetical protein